MGFYQAVKNRSELRINSVYQKTLLPLCSRTYVYKKKIPSKHSLSVKAYINAMECNARTMFAFAYSAFTIKKN